MSQCVLWLTAAEMIEGLQQLGTSAFCMVMLGSTLPLHPPTRPQVPGPSCTGGRVRCEWVGKGSFAE
jgi:hypothetical protein